MDTEVNYNFFMNGSFKFEITGFELFTSFRMYVLLYTIRNVIKKNSHIKKALLKGLLFDLMRVFKTWLFNFWVMLH